MTADRLSDQQADFLCWLLDAYRDLPDDEMTAFGRKLVRHRGVPIGRLPKGTSRAESASISRALRRLEDRGLVERRNDRASLYQPAGQWNAGNRRTTHVRLTAEGWDLAERLTAARAFEITGEGE